MGNRMVEAAQVMIHRLINTGRNNILGDTEDREGKEEHYV